MTNLHALDGIRVLDLGHFLSAPRCGQLLAEMGAAVVKIEPPHGETMRMLMAVAGAEKVLSVVNCNKRGITLNLKNASGRALFVELVKVSDVVLENFSYGVMEQMGLGYERLAEINPRLIYASISGFGNTGPQRVRAAFDIIAQATGGIMDALDQPSRPPGVYFGDLVSGAYAAMAIGFALFAREKTGRGQQIDISMQDVMYAHHFKAHALRALGESDVETAEILGRSIENLLTDHENPVPFWNSYRARDGYVALVALTDRQWNGLMSAIGREDLIGDPRWSNVVTRIHNAAAGVKILSEWAASRTVEDIIHVLKEWNVPCGKVCSIDDLNADEQLFARDMLNEIEHPQLGPIRVAGSVLKMSMTPGEVLTGHPGLGEHTEEVLNEFLGMEMNEVDEWRNRGAL